MPKYPHDYYEKLIGLEYYCGGYFGTSVRMYVDLEKRQVCWTEYRNSENYVGKEKKRKLSAEKAAQLIDGLTELKIANWKKEYNPASGVVVCDGTGWSVELIFPDRKVMRHGYAAFPQRWQEFAILIDEFCGKTN